MSETTTTEKTETTTEATVESGGNFTAPATQADLDRIIADRLSRERAKFGDYDDLKTKAAEYDKVVEANKTEAQKQAEALAASQAKVQEYETREQIAAWKTEVSTETGVPAVALAGSTKEEIEAHAATLKPLIGSAATSTETPRPGVVPTIGKTPATPANIPIKSQIVAAEQQRDEKTAGSAEWKEAQSKVMELKGMQLFEAHQIT